MTSITKIILLITAIIANGGYALDVSGDDIKESLSQFSHMPYDFQQDPPNPRKCDDISGCVTTERSLDYPIDRDYYEVIGPKDPMYSDTKYAISKLPGLRERRQAVVKTKGSDDGPNSVMSLIARSSSPLRSMIRNRNRRSTPETSSKKNPTKVEHTKVVSNQPSTLSKSKRLLLFLITTLTMPYLGITPNHNFYDDVDTSKLYTS